MKSSAGSMPAWNRSNSATAAINASPRSSAWTLTPWPKAGANSSSETSGWTASAKRVADASGWKKNARSHRPNRRTDPAGYGRRPHVWHQVDPADNEQHLRATGHFGDRRKQEHGRPPAETDGLPASREPQTDRLHQEPGPQSTVPLHRPTKGTIRRARPAHHQRRCQEEGTDWQLQKHRSQVGSRSSSGQGSRFSFRGQGACNTLRHL